MFKNMMFNLVRKTTLIALITLGLFCLFQQEALAGAWTVPKQRVWAEYYFKWQWAKEDFGDDYKKKSKAKEARAWDLIMEPKIELGITDWFNLLWSMEYKESKYKEYGRPPDWGPYRRKNTGVTSVKVGAKVRFLEKPFVLSGQIKGYIYPGYGINHGDDPEDRNKPDIGDGDDALELKGLIGKNFDIPLPYKNWKLPCYVAAEAGYRWRSSPVTNDIPLFIETGAWPMKWLLLKTELDTIIAHRDTGSIDKDYMIWRAGPVIQLFGNSAQRQGKFIANVEFQYGLTLLGKNFPAYQELVLKIQAQF
ncbi:MAG: hypothetical protein JW994_04380 [Candidatus Omnitrophica bacterium]|nr:hypothetical protein [Candidatus Omnitrophota bacterium]